MSSEFWEVHAEHETESNGTIVSDGWLLPRVSPMTVLVTAMILALLTLSGSLVLATRGPWLGLRLRAGRACRCWEVASVSPDGPGAGRVHAGEHILALNNGSQTLAAESQVLLHEPDTLPTFAAFNQFIIEQGKVWKLLQAPTLRLHVANRGWSTISPAPRRPILTLPIRYWLTNVVGMVAFLVGVGLWGLRRGQLSTRLLAVSGAGMLLAAGSAAVYVSRELVLSPIDFRTLSWLNHVGILCFSAASLGLLYISPRRLARFPLLPLLAIAVPALLVNELGQWVDLPLHTFYLPLLLIFLGAGTVIAGQWYQTRNDPVDRAVLKWFVLSIFVTIGLSVVISILPALLRHPPLLPIDSSFAIALMMYLGLVLGVVRFRLFELDRWWFEVWLWFFAGVLVVALDATLALAADLNATGAMTMSIIAVGWLYFPARQWLWGRVTAFSRTELEDYLPQLVQTMFAARSPLEFGERWQDFLRQTFLPLRWTPAPQSVQHATLLDEGVRLRVPGLGGEPSLDLEYRRHGHALFSQRDARLADVLYAVAVRAEDSWSALERGARAERERIMRDLHDDVAARLLTLVRRGANARDRELAGGALAALREAVYSLDAAAPLPLHEVLADSRAEVVERLEAEGVTVHWEQDEMDDALSLNPRQTASLRRMIQESVSNALRHAHPQEVMLSIGVKAGQLMLRVLNDGVDAAVSSGEGGHGLNNVRTRAVELGGNAQWQHDTTGRFSVNAWFPVNDAQGNN